MPNNVLRRFDLNAPSTPFSSARCCIDHVVWLEKHNYKDFTNPQHLIKMPSGRNDGKMFTYFTRINASNIFMHGPNSFFEFSHHDPLEARDNSLINRRVDRMLSLRDSESTKVFLYNHRSHNGFSQESATKLFKSFKYLSSLYKNSFFVCMSQSLVKKKSIEASLYN